MKKGGRRGSSKLENDFDDAWRKLEMEEEWIGSDGGGEV